MTLPPDTKFYFLETKNEKKKHTLNGVTVLHIKKTCFIFYLTLVKVGPSERFFTKPC